MRGVRGCRWPRARRWAMRPSDPADIDLSTSLDGDLAPVEMEASAADAGPMNFLRMMTSDMPSLGAEEARALAAPAYAALMRPIRKIYPHLQQRTLASPRTS